MVGPSPEAALLRGLRPQCHYVGHRRPQRTNAALAGASVSYRVLLHSGMGSQFAVILLFVKDVGTSKWVRKMGCWYVNDSSGIKLHVPVFILFTAVSMCSTLCNPASSCQRQVSPSVSCSSPQALSPFLSPVFIHILPPPRYRNYPQSPCTLMHIRASLKRLALFPVRICRHLSLRHP